MLQQDTGAVIVYYLAGTIFVSLLVIILIVYIFLHHKKVLAFRYKIKQEELKSKQSIFDAIHEGEEMERERLSEELHDGIGAKLAGIKMKLEYIKANTKEENTKRLLETTYLKIDESIEELRSVSHNLHPALFAEKDLGKLINDIVEQLNALGKCTFLTYYEVTNNIEISDVIKLHTYRIISELLNNICKHSAAKEVSVQVLNDEGNLEIIVTDDGIGYDFQNPSKKGIGMSNIANRVSICKGKMNIDSSSKGTTIIVILPLVLSK